MKVGHLYTHMSMLDCAIQIRGILGYNQDYTSVIIQWWLKRGHRMDVRPEVVQIRHSDWWKWKEIKWNDLPN